MKNRRWTVKEIEFITTSLENGVKLSSIARQMNLDYHRIHDAIRRYNIPWPKKQRYLKKAA